MFQDAWTVYIISQFIWIINMRQPLLFVPRNTLTNNSRNAILRGPILKLLKLSLHVSVKKSDFKFFFLHKTKYKHWALSIRPKRPKMWKRLQVVREFQGKVWELMNFQNPNYSTKNSRDSGSKIEKKEIFREKIWVYLARLSSFSEIWKMLW